MSSALTLVRGCGSPSTADLCNILENGIAPEHVGESESLVSVGKEPSVSREHLLGTDPEVEEHS